MHTPTRIIDANANRAREALRVLEETARFVLDDPAVSLRLKQMRHDLAQALTPLTDELAYHRDTPGDVGTGLSTPAESKRSGLRDVLGAASARLSEALRVIEEYAKLDADRPEWADLATTAERLRYTGYDVSQQLLTALGSGRGTQWRLCLLLTEPLCTHHDWRSVLQHAVQNGADCIQVREKNMNSADLLQRVREVIEIVNNRAAVIVNDRPDIALLAGADGVHLGQTDLDPREVRKLAGKQPIIGVSTADLEHAKRARACGADYCGVGPMFPTTTKHKPVLAGPAYLRDYLAWNALPHLAIGGITPDNIGELTSHGCKGVAVSSAICSAKDPGAAAASLHSALIETAESPRGGA